MRSSLTGVGVYRRTLQAPLERVWENVFDWEHLPWLHRTSFSAIELIEAESTGWRARVGMQPAAAGLELTLELVTEQSKGRYVARTVEGDGKGSEVWTRLEPLAGGRTRIEVEFLVPGVQTRYADAAGAAYMRLYRRLWDEDEAMMMRRQRLLSAGAAGSRGSTLALGPLSEVRSRLPLRVELDGRPFRVVEVAGELVAHTAICPHWLGPLDDAPLRDGCVECPWHGYRFDLRSGASTGSRKLRLPPAPRVRVDAVTGEVVLGWERPSRG